MDDGVYCSTAGTYFNEREALQEHYQSEFHRRVSYGYTWNPHLVAIHMLLIIHALNL